MTKTQTPVPTAQLATTVEQQRCQQTSPCTPSSYFTMLGDTITRVCVL